MYILKCSDGSFYVGLTHDVAQRLEVHNSKLEPTYTAKRTPVQLVHQESFATLEQAVRRERQLKGWSREKKVALISGDLQRLSGLAVCRNR